MIKSIFQYHSIDYLRNLPLMMVWFWSINLIFFPTWLFASTVPLERIKVLIFIVIWITISCLYLWIWQKKDTSLDKRVPCQKKVSDRYRTYLLLLFIPLLMFLNLIAAKYPLTSSGDEAFHARVFRSIGYGIEVAVSQSLPGPLTLWFLSGIILLFLLLMLWLRLINSSHRRIIYWFTIFILVISLMIVTAFLWNNADKVFFSFFPNEDINQLKVFIRFPPLSKFDQALEWLVNLQT